MRAEQPDGLDKVHHVDDFSLAADLVQEAGMLAAAMLGKGLETHYKTSISDVVSAADHAAEDLVVGRLAKARPEDGLIGEEGHSRPGERTWYIDPVDGTYNFLSGIPYWCSAVGLVDADGPVAGAVYLHLVSAVGDANGRIQISNNRGRVDGWANHARIYGICVAVDGTRRPRLEEKIRRS